jgi:hypothetical protein
MTRDDTRTREAAVALLERLDKEVVRPGMSTATIGGIAKAGKLLESLLAEVADCLDIDFHRRGIGDLCIAISACGTASGLQIVDAIARELRRPRNRLDAVRLLRNRAAHPGRTSPADEARETMRRLAVWLRSILQK